jgi:hypothetical protein
MTDRTASRTPRIQPAIVANGLALGTAAIGALLAYQAGQQNLLYACGLAALFSAAALLFAKGEAQKKEAVQ